jgi:hypothetical protein
MSIQLPKISCYSKNSSGGKTNMLEYGGITLYYSYQTIVAFRTVKTGLVVTQNYWATTTGKHLNWIDGGDKKSRLKADEFKAKLEAALTENGIKAN